MRDKRSYEIKKILKEIYPNSNFKAKIDKYSRGETVWITTDLMKALPCEHWETLEDDTLKYQYNKIMENNSRINLKIQNLLWNSNINLTKNWAYIIVERF